MTRGDTASAPSAPESNVSSVTSQDAIGVAVTPQVVGGPVPIDPGAGVTSPSTPPDSTVPVQTQEQTLAELWRELIGTPSTGGGVLTSGRVTPLPAKSTGPSAGSVLVIAGIVLVAFLLFRRKKSAPSGA